MFAVSVSIHAAHSTHLLQGQLSKQARIIQGRLTFRSRLIVAKQMSGYTARPIREWHRTTVRRALCDFKNIRHTNFGNELKPISPTKSVFKLPVKLFPL